MNEEPRGDEPTAADDLYELLAADPDYLLWLESIEANEYDEYRNRDEG